MKKCVLKTTEEIENVIYFNGSNLCNLRLFLLLLIFELPLSEQTL